MNLPTMRRFAFAMLALVLVAGFAYSFARRSALSTQSSATVNAAVNQVAPHANPRRRADTQAPAPAKPASSVLPADFSELDGKEFVAALAQLERRARGGDAEATRFVFDQLAECSSYSVEDDDNIRTHVDESYQRQRDIDQKIRKAHPGSPPDPRFEATEAKRQKELEQAFDKRDRCTTLSKQQQESRFDLARMMLERHDRRAILDFARFFGGDRAELMRNADRLIELRDMERAELNRLIDAGDLDALRAAAYGYSEESLLPTDPEQAYAYAYAWQLTNAADNGSNADFLIAELANRRLSPQQVDDARVRGEAIHQRCCAQGGATAAPAH